MQLTLPFHPHCSAVPDTHTQLLLAPCLPGFLLPPSPGKQPVRNSWNVPRKLLPWSRPHSSFNTGRKIKKKIAKSFERGGKPVCQSYSLLPCWPGVCQTVQPSSMEPLGTGCPQVETFRGSRDSSLEVARPLGASGATAPTCS